MKLQSRLYRGPSHSTRGRMPGKSAAPPTKTTCLKSSRTPSALLFSDLSTASAQRTMRPPSVNFSTRRKRIVDIMSIAFTSLALWMVGFVVEFLFSLCRKIFLGVSSAGSYGRQPGWLRDVLAWQCLSSIRLKEDLRHHHALLLSPRSKGIEPAFTNLKGEAAIKSSELKPKTPNRRMRVTLSVQGWLRLLSWNSDVAGSSSHAWLLQRCSPQSKNELYRLQTIDRHMQIGQKQLLAAENVGAG